MKTSDIVLLAALGIGGYYLLNKPKEDTGVSGGGISGIDFSGLGGLLSGLGNVPTIITLAGKSDFDISDFTNLLEAKEENIYKNTSEALAAFMTVQQGEKKTLLDEIFALKDLALKQAGEIETGNSLVQKIIAQITRKGEEEKVEEPTVLNSEAALRESTENAATRALRERAGLETVGIGSAYAAGKVLPPVISGLSKIFPRMAASAAPKVATGALRVAGPIGIAYLVADLLATAYEGISGKNIAGGWLGWGEIIGETGIGRSLGFAQESKKVKETEIINLSKYPLSGKVTRSLSVSELETMMNRPKPAAATPATLRPTGHYPQEQWGAGVF